MRISPTYANRNDLSTLLKWKLTIEELIGNNKHVRSLYRAYFFSPKLVSGTIDIFCILSVMFPFVLAGLCSEAVKKILGDEHYDGVAGLTLYLFGVLVLAYLHLFGLVLAGLTIWATFVLWFCFSVMDDYGQELQHEADKKKWATMRAKLA